jgi:hypothetical protein
VRRIVAKWPKRATVENLKTGPKEPRSIVLTESEEAMIVAFRRHTLLPLEFERQKTDLGDRLVRRTLLCSSAINSASAGR